MQPSTYKRMGCGLNRRDVGYIPQDVSKDVTKDTRESSACSLAHIREWDVV